MRRNTLEYLLRPDLKSRLAFSLSYFGALDVTLQASQQG